MASMMGETGLEIERLKQLMQNYVTDQSRPQPTSSDDNPGRFGGFKEIVFVKELKKRYLIII